MLFSQGRPVGGFSYALLQDVARQLGRKPLVKELPWARCLQDVKSGAIDLAVDAYDDAERRRQFLYSTPYHTLTPQVFYRANSTTISPPLRGVSSLVGLNGCGVHEYTYEHYDLDAGRMDLGANSDLSMLQKLKAGRCDYAVEELEYIIGGRSSVPNWLDESDLKSFRPAWARGPQVHYLIGKQHPDAQGLLHAVNLAIAAAEKSGTTLALRKRYFESPEPGAKKP
jgi:ABC-type amino acid transport substrate-binding protein